MSFEVKGTVHYLGPENQITEKFSNRVLVVRNSREHDGKTYHTDTAIEFINKNMDKIDDVNEGDEVAVKFNIEGREHNGKWYNSLRGYAIDVKSSGGPKQKAPEQSPMMDDDDSTLPF